MLRLNAPLFGAIGLLCLAGTGRAQMALPDVQPPTGAELVAQQCGTCHTLDPSEPARQGPTLAGVYGRKAGSVPGFTYSAGFASASWAWDDKTLDAWLENPQALIASAVMPYRQTDPTIRTAIISFLKERH